MTAPYRKLLVLGGTRSGKSRFAERMAMDLTIPVTYVATAQVTLAEDATEDSEWRHRIETHRKRRPADWHCIEEPLSLASILQQRSNDAQCLLIDCVSVWLTNLLVQENENLLRQETSNFVDAVNDYQGQLILVSNETNMGIVPMGELSRRYCDEIGLMHQALAASSDHVVMVIAGLPQYLKGEPL